MAEKSVQRRLAAIVIADVVGYSRLMERDPTGTRERFLTIQNDLIQPVLEDHQGRIVKTMGDAFMIEFGSVVSAVQAAVQIQRRMAEHEENQTSEDGFQFRIGVNTGEIIVEGDDIHGEGVNVAARLEPLAEPGGILVSGRVHEQLHNAVEAGYDFIGEQLVKNVARPVRVYKVLLDPEDVGKGTTQPANSRARQRVRKPTLVATVVFVALLIGGSAWWWTQRPEFKPADINKYAYKLPKKPSIAVLPFDNLTGDRKNEFLSDGLTENIIAILSTQRALFVIARNSSFTFKGKAVKVQQVAEQLSVRYVLEGSVQRQGTQLRVTAQLIDALSGHHLWAGRYDYKMTNVSRYFAIQDQITAEIAKALSVKLIGQASQQRWPRRLWNIDALRKLNRANRAFASWSKDGNHEASKLFAEMLKAHPDTPILLAMLGWCHWQRVVIGVSKQPPQDLAMAQKLAERALAVNKNSHRPTQFLRPLIS